MPENIVELPEIVVTASRDWSGDLATDLFTLYRWLIVLAGVLAVIFLTIAAFKHATTDAVAKRSDLRRRATEIIIGLCLAIGSALILETINPKILSVDLTSIGSQDTKIGANDPNLDNLGDVVTPGVNTGTRPVGPGNGIDSGGGVYEGIYLNGRQGSWVGMNGNRNNFTENGTALVTANGEYWAAGRVSHYGGPNDTGVSATETGAISGANLRSHDPNGLYFAARFDYSTFSRAELRNMRFEAYNPATGQTVTGLRPDDWGPAPSTGRAFDVSPGVLNALGGQTDSTIYIRRVQ
jgi:hypothetical protein